MKQELDLYIKNNLEKDNIFKKFFKQKCNSNVLEDRCISYEASQCMGASAENNVHNFININKDDNNFQKLLFNFIDSKGLKDSDVYNKVHIDRRLFSKIRSDSNYHPSKETILLLGFSLELSEDEIDNLLGSASYTLSKNNYYDLIIRFCFINHIYNIKDINDLLESYNCKLFSY